MGKVVKITGCRLLGEELKRLRGPRTQQDIVELSRSEPLRRRIHPLNGATLSQVENARAMPTLETLHAISVCYQVSAQHLLNFIVEERLSKTSNLPADPKLTEKAFGEALAEGRWYDALSLAIHGERLALNEAQRVAWRANRGSCLIKVGLRTEAIDVLMDCADSPHNEPRQRAWIRLSLIEALIAVSRFTSAPAPAGSRPPDREESAGAGQGPRTSRSVTPPECGVASRRSGEASWISYPPAARWRSPPSREPGRRSPAVFPPETAR